MERSEDEHGVLKARQEYAKQGRWRLLPNSVPCPYPRLAVTCSATGQPDSHVSHAPVTEQFLPLDCEQVPKKVGSSAACLSPRPVSIAYSASCGLADVVYSGDNVPTGVADFWPALKRGQLDGHMGSWVDAHRWCPGFQQAIPP